MGIEFGVESLEEMCDLMCNNRLPRRRAKNGVDSVSVGVLHRSGCDARCVFSNGIQRFAEGSKTMKMVIDISEKDYLNFVLQFDNGILDEKTPSHRAKIAIANGTPLPKCMDCRFFEYDFVGRLNGMPLILSHEICKKWGDGCKTREDGYCFLFKAKEGVEE